MAFFDRDKNSRHVAQTFSAALMLLRSSRDRRLDRQGARKVKLDRWSASAAELDRIFSRHRARRMIRARVFIK